MRGRRASHSLASLETELRGGRGASVYLSRCYDDDAAAALLLMGIAPVWGQKLPTEFKSACLSCPLLTLLSFSSAAVAVVWKCLPI